MLDRKIGKSIVYLKVILLLITLIRWSCPTIAGSSRYFPPEYSEKADEIDNERVEEATNFYNFYKSSTERLYPYSVTIITSNRKENYFIQVLGYLFDEYKWEKRPFVEICNTAENLPEYVGNVGDYVNIFNVSQARHFDAQSLDQRLQKENSDYWRCLNESDRHSRYVILFEDDAVPIAGFSTYMNSLISHLDSHQNIDYVKLYHPQYLRKVPAIPLIVVISLLVSAAVVSQIFGTINRTSFIVFLFFTFVISLYIWHIGGPQFIADLRFLFSRSTYVSTPESCCTPAVVFRTSSIGRIISKLANSVGREGNAKHVNSVKLLWQSENFKTGEIFSHLNEVNPFRTTFWMGRGSSADRPIPIWSSTSGDSVQSEIPVFISQMPIDPFRSPFPSEVINM